MSTARGDFDSVTPIELTVKIAFLGCSWTDPASIRLPTLGARMEHLSGAVEAGPLIPVTILTCQIRFDGFCLEFIAWIPVLCL